MKHLALSVLLILPALSPPPASVAPAAQAEAQLPTFDHRMFDALLTRHVRGDRVDYEGLLKDRALLDAYCLRLEGVTNSDYRKLGQDERFALWANAYNAFTLQLILDNYHLNEPGAEVRRLESIQDLTENGVSPWERKFIAMAGLADPAAKDGLVPSSEAADKELPKLSLDALENGLLRPIFADARVHFAVNCAASSCPPLRAGAFTGADLDAQLDEQTRAFLANPDFNQFDAEAKTIELSKIFEWYAGDFENPTAGHKLRAFLIKYAPARLGEDTAWIADAKLTYREYDWALNDIERR